MILEIFKDSFEYSTKDKESLFKMGLLWLFSFSIIPILFLNGLYYRIMDISLKGTINGDDPLPKFNNWIKTIFEGFKLLLVQFIYALPGTIALIAIVFFYESIDITFSVDPQFLSAVWGLMAVCIFLWLLSYLFAIIATTHMVENNGSLKAAFEFKEIISIIRSIGFKKYIEFYLGYLAIFIGILTMVFSIVFLFASIMGILAIGISSSTEWGVLVISALTSIIFGVLSLFLIPFFKIFEARAIALIYNMRQI